MIYLWIKSSFNRIKLYNKYSIDIIISYRKLRNTNNHSSRIIITLSRKSWKFIFYRYPRETRERKKNMKEYGKDKVIQRIVNSSPAFVSLASSILLETVSRWKLYGIRLCLPLSRTAFHPREGGGRRREGEGIGLNFQEEFHEVYQRLRGNVQGSPALPYEFAIPETRAESFL